MAGGTQRDTADLLYPARTRAERERLHDERRGDRRRGDVPDQQWPGATLRDVRRGKNYLPSHAREIELQR